VAGTHTPAAENTFIHIACEGGVAIIDSDRRLALPHSIEVLLLDAQIPGDLLKLAVLVLGTGEAVTVMVGHDKLHSNTARMINRRRFSMDDHTIGSRSGTGSGHTAHPVYFHDTETAGAVRFEVFIIAEGGDIDTGFPRRLKDRGPFGYFHPDAVNGQGNGPRFFITGYN
jgi:hypothetical protein